MATLSPDIIPPKYTDPDFQTLDRMLMIAEGRQGAERVRQLRAIATEAEEVAKRIEQQLPARP